MFSKQVKQVLQRKGGGTGLAIYSIAKTPLNSVLMDTCQLLWLLRSGKLNGYKVEMRKICLQMKIAKLVKFMVEI